MSDTLPLPKPARNDVISVRGVITEALPNTTYRVQITEGPGPMVGTLALCTLNGTMRRFRIRVLPGDDVFAEVSIYDRARGRITRRLRSEDDNATGSAEVPTELPEAGTQI